MDTRLFLGFLLSLFVSCTGNLDFRKENGDTCKQENIEQLRTLLKEHKAQQAIDRTLQLMREWQTSVSASGMDNAQAKYTCRLFRVLPEAYISNREFGKGIGCIDSIAGSSFWKQHCRYELLVAKARLNQLLGNNEEAIRWADAYMELPACQDADSFIWHAEGISGVYAYCSNDIPKAIRILEKAVDAYRNGGKHPHMLRLISRLGVYYRLAGEYKKAINVTLGAITDYNDSISPQDIVIAYGEQANFYAELGMYEQALHYNSKALHYSLLKDSFGLGDLYRYRAEIFRLLGNKDSVFHYLRLGEQASVRMHSFRGVLVNKIETVKAYLDCPDSLEKAVQLGFSICPDTARLPKWAQYQLELYLGKALQKTGQTDRGISMIIRAAHGFVSTQMLDEEYEANRILMDHYRQQGQYDAFMRYYARSRMFADSLRADEKLRTIAAANIRFDSERKSKENESLAIELKLEQQKRSYQICISIILLMLFASTVAYLVYRRRAYRLLMERSSEEINKLIIKLGELNTHNERLTEQIEFSSADKRTKPSFQFAGYSLLSKEDETVFRQSFVMTYPSYLPELRKHYPQLTRNEELLAMLICLNQSTDEIALIMGINRSSVNVVRSRMRKKMQLAKGDSLDEILKQHLP